MRHILFNTKEFLQQYINLPLPTSIPPITTEKDVAFITGATGFIGGFLLKELIEKKVFKKYVCLIRSEDEVSAYQKLKISLHKKSIDLALYKDQVEVALGDVTQPNLGLSKVDFEKLISSVDVVFHFAATMNWVAPFNQDTVGNIFAVKEIFKFCSSNKTKPLHYASSVGAWSLLNQPDDSIYEDSIHDEPENLPGGYCQSKWINEQVCMLAREKGMPINIYRIGDVKGDSVTGFSDLNNFGNIMMRYIIDKGILFDYNEAYLNYLPVDYLAKAIAHIASFQVVSKNFQFSNSEWVSMKDIYNAANAVGVPLEFVSREKWLATLRLENTNTPAGRVLKPIFRPFRPDVQIKLTTFFGIGANLFKKKHDTSNTDYYLKDQSITCPAMVSDKVLETYLIYLGKSLPVNSAL